MTATDLQVEALARWLHATLAQAPDARPLDWEDLSEGQRGLYTHLARALLEDPPAVLVDALALPAPDAVLAGKETTP